MSTLTLYELTESYLDLLDLIVSGEVEEDDVLDAFIAIDDEIEVKADSYAIVAKRLEADIKMIKEEENRLATKRRKIENDMKNLKSNLEFSMKALDKTKFKTNKFSFNIQKNAPSVQILDESLIADDYIRTKKEVDKTAIKNALKEGVEVEGATLIQTESLRIK